MESLCTDGTLSLLTQIRLGNLSLFALALHLTTNFTLARKVYPTLFSTHHSYNGKVASITFLCEDEAYQMPFLGTRMRLCIFILIFLLKHCIHGTQIHLYIHL